MKHSPRPPRTPADLPDCRESMHVEPFTASAVLLVAVVLVSSIFGVQAAWAQTHSVLYSFKGPPDGERPYSGLILDAAGNLYGTTYEGGASYYGTAFKLAPSGKEKVLYSFLAGYGANPFAGLIRDAKGNLYGTSFWGGSYDLGSVFKLDKKGNETVLHSFRSGVDGQWPQAGLVRDSAGNLYGTTYRAYPGGRGTVFKVNNAGKMTVLYRFTGAPDGEFPIGTLVRDEEGNLYGVTQLGGTSQYDGTVFKLDPTGKETVLYSFLGGVDGWNPMAGLIRDSSGNLYGTTFQGGGTGCGGQGCGTVFKLDTTGKETVLYSFAGVPDGEYPAASLVRDAAGNLYGTTVSGGSTNCGRYGCGTVFLLNTAGKETVLHTFTGGTDGDAPEAGLVMDGGGNLYGTTSYGGVSGNGTVFKLTP